MGNSIKDSEARLVIMPDGENIVRPVGANIVLTCKGQVPDPELITDLRWLGPDGRDLLNEERYIHYSHTLSYNLFIILLLHYHNLFISIFLINFSINTSTWVTIYSIKAINNKSKERK